MIPIRIIACKSSLAYDTPMLFQKIDSSPEVIWRATPPDPLYVDAETTSLVVQVVRRLFHWLSLPHRWVGSILFPACYKDRCQVLRFVESWMLPRALMHSLAFSIGSLSTLCQFRAPLLKGWRALVFDPLLQGMGKRDVGEGQQWIRERFSVRAPQGKIDAFFMAQRKGALPSRTILYSCSQDELAEGKLYDEELLTLAKKTASSVILWNHAGVASSEGPLERSVMVRACKAMLRLAALSHQEVIAYGHSGGSDLLLEALAEEAVQAKTVVVVRGAAVREERRWARLLGWGFDNERAVQKIQAPLLALHTACVASYTPLQDSGQLIPDTVIEDPRATLGHALLKQQSPSARVIGIPSWHDEELDTSTMTFLARDILLQLRRA